MIIKVTLLSNKEARVVIPKKMKSEAPAILGLIWREEFADRLDYLLDLTDTPGDYVDSLRLNRKVLVSL